MALPVLNATKQQFTMSKKPFCVALCTLLLALCSSVDAQQQPLDAPTLLKVARTPPNQATLETEVAR